MERQVERVDAGQRGAREALDGIGRRGAGDGALHVGADGRARQPDHRRVERGSDGGGGRNGASAGAAGPRTGRGEPRDANGIVDPEREPGRGGADGTECAAGGAAGCEIAAVPPVADAGRIRGALWPDGSGPERGDRVAEAAGIHRERRSAVAQCDLFWRHGGTGGVGFPDRVASLQAERGDALCQRDGDCGFRRDWPACC